MMVTVVIVFTMCWLPFNVLVLLLNDDDFKMWDPLPYFWFAFHWLAMSHSCYNPIIYCYMNARFRGGFLQIIYRVPVFRRCFCLRRYLHNRGDRNYDATGEMTFKFNADRGGGLLRKPKIRIRVNFHVQSPWCYGSASPIDVASHMSSHRPQEQMFSHPSEHRAFCDGKYYTP
ncbi:RYamide receptor-like isoform X1 [Anastrepha obliqua]|uniref:RYamide receptor-like isoform X1 n=1 Tax=Anastrepha obliqua TaxID=95512 RepID=UPI0024095953|nr:RYamide receptor-like isoform X1 [Anastrepha obliqua]